MDRRRKHSKHILPRLLRARQRPRLRAWLPVLAAAAMLGLTSAGPGLVRAQEDFKRAPSADELDARTQSWIRGRRVMAVVIVGGTVVAGAAASVLRRRKRRQSAEPGRENPS